VRVDEADAGFIADADANKVLWLDHKAKVWRQTALAADTGSQRAKYPNDAAWQGRLGNLNAELRGSGRLRFVPTGETRQIAGVSARRIDVFRGNRKIREHWAAESVSTEEVSSITLKLAENDPALIQERYFQDFQATAHLGYPVLVRDLERGVVVEVKEIKTGAVPAALFGAPAGYRRSDQ
jgi:hypothetical protein